MVIKGKIRILKWEDKQKSHFCLTKAKATRRRGEEGRKEEEEEEEGEEEEEEYQKGRFLFWNHVFLDF